MGLVNDFDLLKHLGVSTPTPLKNWINDDAFSNSKSSLTKNVLYDSEYHSLNTADSSMVIMLVK